MTHDKMPRASLAGIGKDCSNGYTVYVMCYFGRGVGRGDLWGLVEPPFKLSGFKNAL